MDAFANVLMYKWMDGWMDGWIDGYMDRGKSWFKGRLSTA
jgi:hypothetical protein